LKQKIRALIVIEVLGSPKEHVENVMKQIIEKLEKEKGIKLIEQTTYKAEQQKNKLWSTFADIELYAESIERLLGLCFDYMPSSVEIIEPDELKIKSIDLTNFINDLQARLHRYDMLIKSLNAENILLKRELNKFIKRTKTS